MDFSGNYFRRLQQFQFTSGGVTQTVEERQNDWGSNALVRFDPKTEKFQSFAIPSGEIFGGIIRNMRVTRDGKLIIHQSSTNHIGVVDVKGTRSSTN